MVIEYRLVRSDYERAREIAEGRRESAVRNKRPGVHGGPDDDMKADMIGAIAEVVTARVFNVPLLDTVVENLLIVKKKNDVGPLEVRGTDYATGGLLIRSRDKEAPYASVVVDRYAWLGKIMGWIRSPKPYRVKSNQMNKKGRQPCYIIRQSHLDCTDSLCDFMHEHGYTICTVPGIIRSGLPQKYIGMREDECAIAREASRG